MDAKLLLSSKNPGQPLIPARVWEHIVAFALAEFVQLCAGLVLVQNNVVTTNIAPNKSRMNVRFHISINVGKVIGKQRIIGIFFRSMRRRGTAATATNITRRLW